MRDYLQRIPLIPHKEFVMKTKGMSIATQDLANILISMMECELRKQGKLSSDIEYRINIFREQLIKDNSYRLSL